MGKICSSCRNDLPVTEFYADRHRKDGLKCECKTCRHEALRKWRAKPSSKAIIAEHRIKYRSREKTKANNDVTQAIKTGRLIRQPCFICGAHAQAHHSSYAADMRLDVTWLCPQHHKDAHMLVRRVAA